MIERISNQQAYLKIEEQQKAKQQDAAKKDIRVEVRKQEQLTISNEAKRAAEVAKYTKQAKEVEPEKNERVKELKNLIGRPAYLQNMARSVAERIAEKIVQSIDARYNFE